MHVQKNSMMLTLQKFEDVHIDNRNTKNRRASLTKANPG
jgi:hypothetical protein